MKLASFSIARLPRIEFGSGVVSKVPQLASAYGRHALVITGNASFVNTRHWCDMTSAFGAQGVSITHLKRSNGEPTPEDVDHKVRALAGEQIDVVVGIGGGSALDEAKAVAGLLKVNRPVIDYLEGVGPESPYEGPATPFIAVPTTAGTGSEATKNAVLSKHGKKGYKKSFRDDKLVAEWAVVDPDLIATCPKKVLAGNGMDAFTQLLESYVSLKANPLTDGLALQGLKLARDGLLPLYDSDGDDARSRCQMAMASLMSGINLAQTGLGSVHGLASPLGAYFPIPHGIVCGTLVAAATAVNIEALKARSPKHKATLIKYANVGRLLAQEPRLPDDEAHDRLNAILKTWTRKLELPPLSKLGIKQVDFGKIVANVSGSSMKTNPLELKNEEVEKILSLRHNNKWLGQTSKK